MIAQFLKGAWYIIVKRKIDFTRFVGPGGMPSSHSAFVTSLTVGVALKEGLNSTAFAMAVVFALIVMYDAAGIRRAAGRQAVILNKIVDELFHHGHVKEERLKELLGHTPVEVFVGAILGGLIAYYVVS